jgi:serine phosphatase RsbU (regulator of sigma subunit)
MKKIIFFQLLFLKALCGFSGNPHDSLRAVLDSSPADSVRIATLIELSAISEGPEKRKYLDQAMKWARRTNDVQRIAVIYEKIGDLFYPYQIDSAGYYFELSLEAHQFSFNNKENVARGFNTMGTVYWYKNELSDAILYYMKALEINQDIGNDYEYAKNCLNISMVYSQLGEYEKALDFHRKMEQVDIEVLGDDFMHAAMNTRGILLINLKLYEEAKEVHSDNVVRAKRIGDSYRIGMSLENLGITYKELHKPDSALFYLKLALDESEYRQDFEFAGLYNNLADAYASMKNYKEAVINYERALEYGLRSDYKPWLIATYKGLSDVYRATGNFDRSIFYLDKYIATKDSLVAEENQAQLSEMQAKYESLEKEQEIQMLKKNEQLGKIELERRQEVIKGQDQRQFFFIVCGLILLILVVVILAAFIAKRKSNQILQQQKAEIQEQHVLLVEKNNEIIDSLNYSKRLQTAILPPKNRFDKYFDSYFVLYLPKSIVSGDFYWLEETNGKVHLAVADCTGHGVPGALVSVVCSNALSRVLYETNPKNPAEILDKSRDLIINYFSRNEGNINDGMDISVVTLHMAAANGGTLNNGNGNMKVDYAGANNPLWLIRPSTGSGLTELLEWKADKQSIGKIFAEKRYNNNELTVQKGDLLYLASDGFEDQFGGEKGKKYKAAQLKELLLKIHGQPLEKQKQLLQAEFERWKGDLDQIDDICIIGIRV